MIEFQATAAQVVAVILFYVGLLGAAVAITALVCRCRYGCQRRRPVRGRQIRRRIPAPRPSGQRGHLPMFTPGQARPMPPLPPLAVTAIQPAVDESGRVR